MPRFRRTSRTSSAPAEFIGFVPGVSFFLVSNWTSVHHLSP
jgi:hypothetical protein